MLVSRLPIRLILGPSSVLKTAYLKNAHLKNAHPKNAHDKNAHLKTACSPNFRTFVRSQDHASQDRLSQERLSSTATMLNRVGLSSSIEYYSPRLPARLPPPDITACLLAASLPDHPRHSLPACPRVT